MAKNTTTNLSFDEFAKFLEPIVNVLNCDRTSLTNLRQNYRKVISKLNQTGRPVLLTIQGQTLLLCDANLYFSLENKRRSILSRFKSVEDAIQIGKIDPSDDKIVRLQNLQWEIATLEAQIQGDAWTLEEGKKELTSKQTEADSLITTLKKSNTKAKAR